MIVILLHDKKKFRKEEVEVLGKIEKKVIKIIKSCDVQKNEDLRIKKWLKNSQSFIQDAKDKHQTVESRDINLEAAIGYAAYNCKEHN